MTGELEVADELRIAGLAAMVWVGAVVGGRSGTWPLDPDAVWSAGGLGLTVVLLISFALRSVSPTLGVAVTGCLLAGLFAFAIAARAEQGFQPMEPGLVHSNAVVRSDPEPVGSGWRFELQLESGQRVDATGFGTAGFTARQLEVGQEVTVAGRIRSIGERPWLQNRHLVGRLSLDSIALVTEAGHFNRTVNEVRRVVADGAVGFDSRAEALYLGLVIGDDRFQHLSQKAQFRAAGLTHLLAVSGQNVAFVLLVVRPILLLCGFRLRLMLILLVLIMFAAVTRAEPSVLRATAAAVVGAWATATGRSRSGLRALSGGVIVMILLDPFLVRVVGFQLSVAASGGIVVLAPTLVRRIPLPTVVAEPLAVTIAAQVAVAPLLVGYFGPLPLAAVPANLLAGWAAGAVMTAGLTVGPVAGLLQSAGLSPLADMVQMPTRLLVQWIDTSAQWSSAVGLPWLDGRAMLTVAAVLLTIASRPRQGAVAWVVLVIGTAVLTFTMVTTAPHRPSSPIEFSSGAYFLPAGGADPAVLVLPGDCSPAVVDELLAHDIATVDVVVSESGGRQAGRLVTAVIEVAKVELVLAPSLHRIRGATRVTNEKLLSTEWGALVVDSIDGGHRLAVRLAD